MNNKHIIYSQVYILSPVQKNKTINTENIFPFSLFLCVFG